MKYEKIFSTVTTFYIVQAVSDENVTVIDREFNNIPVRLYLPKRKLERKRPAVIFIHGGIFVFGSCSKYISDMCVVHIFIFKKVLGIDRVLSI
jgi:arylacetamide deacetylase-like 2